MGKGSPGHVLAEPIPVPHRYHNGTLLERKVHGYSSRLALKGLALEQAGTYHCKASSEAGAIKSAPAQLTVLGESRVGLVTHPTPHQPHQRGV